MSGMEWDELGSEIYERGRASGRFGSRTGGVGGEHFDKYRFQFDPRLLRAIAEALVTLLPGDVEALAGLELGGVPLAAVCSQRCGLASVLVRRAPRATGHAASPRACRSRTGVSR